MVAALNCDYDRLEELRDQRKDLADNAEEAVTYPDADDESAGDAVKALAEWDEENGEELADLEDEAGDCTDADDARERIYQDPLSVRIFGERVDGEWTADRFEILLCTGGPAVRIMGELDGNGEPDRAWLEVQDWFKPWTQYYTEGIGEVLLDYCRCFCFE